MFIVLVLVLVETLLLLFFFCVFITWIGTETVPAFVEEVDVAEEEQQDEEYDNDVGITVRTSLAGLLLLVILTGIERNSGF